MNKSSLNPIVTIDSSSCSLLYCKTEPYEENQLDLARQDANKLKQVIAPLMPAAGLAAPQIGILRSIFVYSYDRDPIHLEVVINPKIESIEGSSKIAWEGCFSTVLCKEEFSLANVSRYEKIFVSYLNLQGERIYKVLEGFAARVFQHEYDHLQGAINIDKKDVAVKRFNSKSKLLEFIAKIKKNDQTKYVQPKTYYLN